MSAQVLIEKVFPYHLDFPRQPHFIPWLTDKQPVAAKIIIAFSLLPAEYGEKEALLLAQRLLNNVSTLNFQGKCVLDAFCGRGTLAQAASDLGCSVWGIDINPVAVLVSSALSSVVEATGSNGLFALFPQTFLQAKWEQLIREVFSSYQFYPEEVELFVWESENSCLSCGYSFRQSPLASKEKWQKARACPACGSFRLSSKSVLRAKLSGNRWIPADKQDFEIFNQCCKQAQKQKLPLKYHNARQALFLASVAEKLRALPRDSAFFKYATGMFLRLVFSANKHCVAQDDGFYWRTWGRLTDARNHYVELGAPVLKKLALKDYPNLTRKPFCVVQGNALWLPFPDNFFDVVVADPPYIRGLVSYDDYGELFYPWLKHLGFSFPLPPKKQQLAYRDFLLQFLKESARVLKDNAVLCMMFSSYHVSVWKTLLSSIQLSPFVVTAFWPVKTAGVSSRTYILLVLRKSGKITNPSEKLIRNALEEAFAKLPLFFSCGIRNKEFLQAFFASVVCAFSMFQFAYPKNPFRFAVRVARDFCSEWLSDFPPNVRKAVQLGQLPPLENFKGEQKELLLHALLLCVPSKSFRHIMKLLEDKNGNFSPLGKSATLLPDCYRER